MNEREYKSPNGMGCAIFSIIGIGIIILILLAIAELNTGNEFFYPENSHYENKSIIFHRLNQLP